MLPGINGATERLLFSIRLDLNAFDREVVSWVLDPRCDFSLEQARALRRYYHPEASLRLVPDHEEPEWIPTRPMPT